jgi:DNA-binding NarL/FixJ family response regulator
MITRWCRRIRKKHSDVRMLALSMHVADGYVLRALQAGASGYVPKGSTPSELELAIYAVARGDLFLSPSISKSVMDAYLEGVDILDSPLDQLTSRQREVLQLIVEGYSMKEIANRIDASVKTVEAHRANLMDRLGIHNVPGLVRYAIRSGLIPPE